MTTARRRLTRLASIAAGLLLWEALSRLVVNDKLFLAAPSEVIQAIVRLAVSGRLGHDVAVSALEFVIGFGIASVLGITLGVLMASSERAKEACEPWVQAFNATPTVALAPLFILWAGVGIWSKVMMVVIVVVFTISINTEVGIRTTSPRLVETFRSFGATRSQIFWKLSLPSALPFILAGLKLGTARGLIGVVVAELFGARAGLGNLISESAANLDMPSLFGGVVVLAAAGIGLTSTFRWLEQRMVPWRGD
ncbi:MAG TPA: ABC transporter permease [Xanthobacteraceae bacterium]|nr:ABC transporter permease [Xanthobacteraceae bacterium]